MKEQAIIVIYHPSGGKVLLERRGYESHQHLYDFPYAHAVEGQDSITSAYHMLREAVGIDMDILTLAHAMEFAYPATQQCYTVLHGVLQQLATVMPPFIWADVTEDFQDTSIYAGEGYIGHVLSHLQMQVE